MCSPKVAIFTGVLLQVKTFVLYTHHYDHEVLPGEVHTFFKALSRRSYYQFQLSVKARLLIRHWPNRIFYLSAIYFSLVKWKVTGQYILWRQQTMIKKLTINYFWPSGRPISKPALNILTCHFIFDEAKKKMKQPR